MITHAAIMPHVSSNQHVVVIADDRLLSGIRRAVHRTIFAEHIVMSHFQIGRLTLVLQILAPTTNITVGIKLIAFAKRGRAVDSYVAVKHATFAQLHLVADHTERADINVVSQFRTRMNNCTGMDFCHGSGILPQFLRKGKTKNRFNALPASF